MKTTKKKISTAPERKIVYALAARWDKDYRTVRDWFEDNNPMLEHPDSIAIINGKEAKKLIA